MVPNPQMLHQAKLNVLSDRTYNNFQLAVTNSRTCLHTVPVGASTVTTLLVLDVCSSASTNGEDREGLYGRVTSKLRGLDTTQVMFSQAF